jgi:hypothetical protein
MMLTHHARISGRSEKPTKVINNYSEFSTCPVNSTKKSVILQKILLTEAIKILYYY